jgi:Flp pilus assembly CpaF family ATPase
MAAPSARMIASAIDLIVFIKRTQSGRAITDIVEVKGVEGGDYVTTSIE